MFCSNCGKSKQEPDSHCRACGEFLNDPSSKMPAFGGNTTRQNINSINILSLIAAFASLLAAIWMYVTQFNVPTALYFGASILLCSAFWHLSNVFVAMKLKRRLEMPNTSAATNDPLQPAKALELQPEMNQRDLVPPSITEQTTKHLGGKVRR
jgi:hypothetical protein